MNKIIIGLVGEFGTGKGTTAAYLKKKYKAEILKFSNPLNDILHRLNYDVTRNNLDRVVTALRKEFGENILAKTLITDINKKKNKIIVIDGFRKLEELRLFKKINGFFLVNLTADARTRYERLLKRNEKRDDQKKKFKNFLREHKNISDKDIIKVGKQADFQVDNSSDEKKLYLQIDNIIKQINEKK